ncbi:MAG: hypothetical protein M0Z70_14220 [Nitrospiraceae bacterium]|nr:hypothetical protein [Nitrospirota bacterium]MDA8340451.1 hypothetical protein [Nitrospiraceae bacterium]
MGVFETKKQEVMLEKQDFDILLDGETKRLLKNILDEDIEKFKKELISQVMANLENYYNENKSLSLKELHKALEQQVITDVKQAFTGWRFCRKIR